jgi:hypothetical protein
MTEPTSSHLGQAIEAAYRYLIRGPTEFVRTEPLDAVLADGTLIVGGDRLRASGSVRGLKAGDEVDVLWSQRPNSRRIGRKLVLRHQARRGIVPRTAITAALIEQLFIARNATGELDVWFRNDQQCTPLGITRTQLDPGDAIASARYTGTGGASGYFGLGAIEHYDAPPPMELEEPRVVRWGARADSFFVMTPSHRWHVFTLARQVDQPLSGQPSWTREYVANPCDENLTLATVDISVTTAITVKYLHAEIVGTGVVLTDGGNREFTRAYTQTGPVKLKRWMIEDFYGLDYWGIPFLARGSGAVTDVQLDEDLQLHVVLHGWPPAGRISDDDRPGVPTVTCWPDGVTTSDETYPILGARQNGVPLGSLSVALRPVDAYTPPPDPYTWRGGLTSVPFLAMQPTFVVTCAKGQPSRVTYRSCESTVSATEESISHGAWNVLHIAGGSDPVDPISCVPYRTVCYVLSPDESYALELAGLGADTRTCSIDLGLAASSLAVDGSGNPLAPDAATFVASKSVSGVAEPCLAALGVGNPSGSVSGGTRRWQAVEIGPVNGGVGSWLRVDWQEPVFTSNGQAYPEFAAVYTPRPRGRDATKPVTPGVLTIWGMTGLGGTAPNHREAQWVLMQRDLVTDKARRLWVDASLNYELQAGYGIRHLFAPGDIDEYGVKMSSITAPYALGGVVGVFAHGLKWLLWYYSVRPASAVRGTVRIYLTDLVKWQTTQLLQGDSYDPLGGLTGLCRNLPAGFLGRDSVSGIHPTGWSPVLASIHDMQLQYGPGGFLTWVVDSARGYDWAARQEFSVNLALSGASIAVESDGYVLTSPPSAAFKPDPMLQARATLASLTDQRGQPVAPQPYTILHNGGAYVNIHDQTQTGPSVHVLHLADLASWDDEA